MMNDRFCKDCKWFKDGNLGLDEGYSDLCVSPLRPRNLVNGNPKRTLCHITRSNWTNDPAYCGGQGSWFEVKESHNE